MMRIRHALLLLPILPLLSVPSCFAWGNKGHRIINRLAAQSLPTEMPAFMRSPEAINEIDYLGPEPDRWRSRAEPELSAAQAPDHFIDIEYADLIGTLPRERYQYIAALYAYAAAHPDRAADVRPEKVGFQPYITSEVWERLKSAMRDYRALSAAHKDTQPVEAAILYYAGWLGHYVGDGSQPLHVTIQYNGWTGPNPNGYTTEHHIHSLFESDFVDTAVNASDVEPLLSPVHPIGDEWDDYLAYLRHTGSLVERVYQFDKAHAFDGAGTPDSRQFTAERLAAGASMLRDLYIAAWTKSAEPVPDWHDQHDNAATTTLTVAPLPPGVTIQKTEVAESSSETQGSALLPTVPFTGKTYKIGAGVSPPHLTYAPNPHYPAAERKAKVEGIVRIGLVVDERGQPRNVHVVRSLETELDRRAVEAVSHYRFEPAVLNGRPVPVEINVEVNFQLD